MLVGTRILYPEEVDIWDAELLQISVYRGMKGNLEFMRDCAARCKEKGIPYVIHPVGYSLLQKAMLPDIREMAECAGLAIILHDEKAPDGGRLEGANEDTLRRVLEEIGSITDISFENATDTRDILWFWDKYAESVTLDIGHVESSEINSIDFIRALDETVLKKIQFVHIHRNNGLHGGITDHWPLSRNCREVKALKDLIKKIPAVKVILEINEIEDIRESLNILRGLRE
jgi:sugar phosphate isomerase/epimerase